MNTKLAFVAPIALACGLLTGTVQAQPIADFQQAVTQAVLTNPQVNAAWYNFEATREAQRAAQGGYFPSVDLYADVGREERETPLVDFGDYSRDAARLSITQMLFDGFATREAVKQAGFEKLSQYYELQRASQEIALEAAQAYLDTVRYQKLVRYAEDNYVVHRQVFDKIAERTGGGVEVSFEAVGIQVTFVQALEVLKKGGHAVVVGLNAEPQVTLPANIFVQKEISLSGTQGYCHDFQTALALLENGAVDLSPFITHTLPSDAVQEGFDLLTTPGNEAVKVVIIYNEGN